MPDESGRLDHQTFFKSIKGEQISCEDGDELLPHFTLVVYTGGKAQPKDFPCPVVIDLAGLDIPSQKIPVCG